MGCVAVSANPTKFMFLKIGHAYTHLFLLLYPTVVLALEAEFKADYAELAWSFRYTGLLLPR